MTDNDLVEFLASDGILDFVHTANIYMDRENIPALGRTLQLPGSAIVTYYGEKPPIHPIRIEIGRIEGVSILLKVEFRNQENAQ